MVVQRVLHSRVDVEDPTLQRPRPGEVAAPPVPLGVLVERAGQHGVRVRAEELGGEDRGAEAPLAPGKALLVLEDRSQEALQRGVAGAHLDAVLYALLRPALEVPQVVRRDVGPCAELRRVHLHVVVPVGDWLQARVGLRHPSGRGDAPIHELHKAVGHLLVVLALDEVPLRDPRAEVLAVGLPPLVHLLFEDAVHRRRRRRHVGAGQRLRLLVGPLVEVDLLHDLLRRGLGLLLLQLGADPVQHRRVLLVHLRQGPVLGVLQRLHLPLVALDLAQLLDATEGQLLRVLHLVAEELEHLARRGYLAVGDPVEVLQHWLPAPHLVQPPDVARPTEEDVEERVEEVVVGVAGRVHAVLEDAHQAAAHLLLHHAGEAVPIQHPVAVASLRVRDHDLRDAVDSSKVLVLRADDVERRHVELPSQLAVLRLRSEVAVLDAEGVDEAAEDHRAVLLVVEARNGHGALRGAAHVDALHLDEVRQALNDHVKLAAAELVAPLVELPEVVGVRKDAFSLGRVAHLPAGVRAVHEVSCPVVDVVRGLLEGLQILVPHLAHGRVLGVGEAVGNNHDDAKLGDHAADAHVVPAVPARAVAVHQGPPEAAELELLEHREAAPQPEGGAAPARGHPVEQLPLHGVLDEGVQLRLPLRGERLALHARHPLRVAHRDEGAQLPDAAKPQRLRLVALVVHVGLQAELPHRRLRQEELGVVHQRRLRRRLDRHVVAHDTLGDFRTLWDTLQRLGFPRRLPLAEVLLVKLEHPLGRLLVPVEDALEEDQPLLLREDAGVVGVPLVEDAHAVGKPLVDRHALGGLRELRAALQVRELLHVDRAAVVDVRQVEDAPGFLLQAEVDVGLLVPRRP
mmetsp:Transcript_20868/g.46319  ORF Transcript_20868/g.46319 Transcript_20868/m.46319 type:complete len:853 (+) Transcript_20868:1248-3806(+)